MLRAEDLPLRPKQTRTQAAKRKRRAAFSLPVANAYPSKQETVSTERTQQQGRLVLSNFTRVRFQTSAEKDPSTVGSRSGAGEQAFAKIISPLTHIPGVPGAADYGQGRKQTVQRGYLIRFPFRPFPLFRVVVSRMRLRQYRRGSYGQKTTQVSCSSPEWPLRT